MNIQYIISITSPLGKASLTRFFSFAPLFCAVNVIIEWEILCSGIRAKFSILLAALKAAITETPW